MVVLMQAWRIIFFCLGLGQWFLYTATTLYEREHLAYLIYGMIYLLDAQEEQQR